jgi:predicted  nucleic acid-binding Zn ribbon protein
MLAEYVFAPRTDGDEARRELDDWVHALFARYRNNGQVWGPVVTGWVGGALRATFHVPTPDALDARYQSRGVAGTLDKVRALCGKEPSWKLVGDAADTPAGTLDGVKALLLRTDLFGEGSPVREGNEGTPVPLYRLPVDWQVREHLTAWMRRAQLHDELWINSGRLETAAYHELADPASTLSAEGRELARTLEQLTGVATYYFLKHYWGRRKEDARDACPGCGEPWADDPLGTGPQGLDAYAYRCDACRLVSETATATALD